MRRVYESWSPKGDTLAVVRQADAICRDYAAQGYDLTLRQCYYQFVARGLIENTERSYKRLGSILNRARMAGLLDWSYIVDRTRNLERLPHWTGPADVLQAAASGYGLDLWSDQPVRVEVWVEKEALAGVVERAAQAWDCAYFSCRGYVSQSEQWAAGQRFLQYLTSGQRVLVIHLGDHDPSGIDMTRDIRDRLATFLLNDWSDMRGIGYEPDDEEYGTPAEDVWDDALMWCDEHENFHEGETWWPFDEPFAVHRIALNRDQIDQYRPPPNPAKMTDSRAGDYVAEHGRQSWELDALDPATLDALIQRTIGEFVDETLLEARREQQEADRSRVLQIAEGFER